MPAKKQAILIDLSIKLGVFFVDLAKIKYFQVLKFEAGMGVQCHAARSLCEEENHLTRRREDTLRLQTTYLGRRQTESGTNSDCMLAEHLSLRKINCVVSPYSSISTRKDNVVFFYPPSPCERSMLVRSHCEVK